MYSQLKWMLENSYAKRLTPTTLGSNTASVAEQGNMMSGY